MKKRFAIIGAAGYIAPRHLQAIKETGNEVVVAFDPSDSVGILDSYFPDADFFTEFERFDRHLDKLRREDSAGVHSVAICSPNYLHDSHIRFALRSGADAVCEKPLVLYPADIDDLCMVERDTGGTVNSILQLRLHPAITGLRDQIGTEPGTTRHEVDLTYITSRGHWYLQSWKGDAKKSGGIATNIGVHFFDMLHFIFGGVVENVVNYIDDTAAAGYLEYENARVRWFLSTNYDYLPASVKATGQRTYRSITVDGNEIEFSSGFTDLHTRSYEEILAGRGYGIEENRVAIQTVSDIRKAEPVGMKGEYHPFLKQIF